MLFMHQRKCQQLIIKQKLGLGNHQCAFKNETVLRVGMQTYKHHRTNHERGNYLINTLGFNSADIRHSLHTLRDGECKDFSVVVLFGK